MRKNITKCLEYAIYWSIVFIPFSISIAPAFTYTFMGLAIFSFLLKKIIKKEKFFINTVINMPFMLLFLLSIVSFKNSIDYKVSLRGITKLIQNAFIFLICAEYIKGKRHLNWIVFSMIAGAALASFDGLWQIWWGKDFIRGNLPIINIGLRRATAAFPNANVLGIYLACLFPLAFGFTPHLVNPLHLWRGWRGTLNRSSPRPHPLGRGAGFTLHYLKEKKRILMFVTVILILAGILLTFSRPAILASFVSLFFLSIVKKDKIIISLLVITLILAPFILPKPVKDWARQINYNPIIFMCNTDRISVFRNSVNMIRQHPFIGVGVNTFSKNYLRYKLPELPGRDTGDAMYAHNNFLHIAGEIGLLGLVAFIWLLVRLFLYCSYLYKNFSDTFLKSLSLFLCISLVAFLVNGLTESSLYYARVAMIFWYITGVLLSLKKFLSLNIDRGSATN